MFSNDYLNSQMDYDAHMDMLYVHTSIKNNKLQSHSQIYHLVQSEYIVCIIT